MFYLPDNATVFRENPVFPEYSADKKETYLQQRKISETDTKASPVRWAIYQFIVDRLKR